MDAYAATEVISFTAEGSSLGLRSALLRAHRSGDPVMLKHRGRQTLAYVTDFAEHRDGTSLAVTVTIVRVPADLTAA